MVLPPVVISVDEPTDIDKAIAEVMADVEKELVIEEAVRPIINTRIHRWWQILTKSH